MENDKNALAPLQEVRYRTGPRWNRIFTSLALAVFAVVAWQAYDSRQNIASLRADLDRRAGDSDKAAAEAHALALQREASIKALQDRIDALETQARDTQSQFATIDDLHAEFERARDERAVNEIAQAIEIASQQLQLAGSVSGALAALQSADSRLALLDPTRYTPVRKLLARDIERLKTLPLADVPRMALQLESLIGRVDTLPLAFERTLVAPARPQPQAAPTRTRGTKPAAAAQSAPAASASGVTASPGRLESFAKELWQEFSSLIRIERLDRPEPALLAPEQASYLRANLRLRLLSARIALMQRENRTFADDLGQARAWIQRYFDVQSPRVAQTLSELDGMSHTRLDVDLPSLDETQTALRNIKPARR